MTKYLHTNNASSNLRTTINAIVTSLQVTSGQGVLFPNPVTGEGFFITVEDRRIGRLEIMLCTSRISDTLTVVRGQQGTVPQSFGAGVNVSNRLTALVLNDFVDRTTEVIPASQIPPITNAMMAPSGIDANKTTTGVFNALRIPAITSAMITSLDATKLTGTILAARLPSPIPAANIPPITSAMITSLDAAKLTGTANLPAGVLPAIPSSKLTSVPAGALTGVVPNASISGSYNNFVNISGSGATNFNEYRAFSNGSFTDPSFTWEAAQDAGMYYSPTNGPAFTFGGAAAFSVNDTAARVWGTTVFAGSGAGLTNIPASQLSGNVQQDNLAAILHAAGAAPMYVARAWVKWTLPGTIVADSNVTSVTSLGGGQYRITFTTPMDTAHYAAFFSHSSPGDGATLVSFSTTSVTVQTAAGAGNTACVIIVG